ncbi:MAG: DNA-processing protein DprA [Oceanipulchritudo sp.]
MILAALPGLGPVNIRRLDAAMAGGVERLLGMDSVERSFWCGPRVVSELAEWKRYFDPEKVFAALGRMEADYLTYEEEGYPDRLRHFGDRPVGLYRCRAGKEVGERSLAVVGTRRPSGYGRKVARAFAEFLGRSGYTIVSGLAEGIDTEAHRAALQAGAPTAAVLGGGLNCCYPASNRGLLEEVKESGGVWTEFPLWRRADRRSFPQRNRIVAGMSEAVLVVESGMAGGSLITARMAAEQGKPVYVVPGRIDAAESAGCHALIRDGAQLVTSPEEILEDLNYLPGMLRPGNGSAAASFPSRKEGPEPELHGLPARVWSFLGEKGHAHMDAMAAGLGVPVAELSGAALEMEVQGLICRRLDGCYERG